jgi:hypothetical protein
MPLAAPFPLLSYLARRGLRFGALSALRGTSGGATMSTPGVAGTQPTESIATSSVLGAPASIMGSGLSRYGAPALRLDRWLHG